mmetsp:Transcript_73417/g.153246  ORF Transcript_73417/g.153246 Transcript_73417/m.153246 type:complete len:223 (-) Transcript_73417:78-746(-)
MQRARRTMEVSRRFLQPHLCELGEEQRLQARKVWDSLVCKLKTLPLDVHLSRHAASSRDSLCQQCLGPPVLPQEFLEMHDWLPAGREGTTLDFAPASVLHAQPCCVAHLPRNVDDRIVPVRQPLRLCVIDRSASDIDGIVTNTGITTGLSSCHLLTYSLQSSNICWVDSLLTTIRVDILAVLSDRCRRHRLGTRLRELELQNQLTPAILRRRRSVLHVLRQR